MDFGAKSKKCKIYLTYCIISRTFVKNSLHHEALKSQIQMASNNGLLCIPFDWHLCHFL